MNIEEDNQIDLHNKHNSGQTHSNAGGGWWWVVVIVEAVTLIAVEYIKHM